MNNKKVKINSIENLSKNWYKLDKVNFDYQLKNGEWQNQSRESYDRGDGAAILLYNPLKKTVILTKQFRMPSYLNENEDEGKEIIVSLISLLDEAPLVNDNKRIYFFDKRKFCYISLYFFSYITITFYAKT